MLARPARRATYHRAPPEGIGDPGKLILQNERELTFFLPLLSRKKFTVVTGELERNERACLSLTHAFLSP